VSVQQLPFLEILQDVSRGNIKTPQKEFLSEGDIPVVDQGKQLIAGYTNDPARVCKVTPPVIVFGDHTRAIKFLDFEFAMGADGTKVLAPRIECDLKYFYHALRATHIPDAGYSRHFKFLKETKLPVPTLSEQKRIAAILDAADALRAKRRETLAQLDTLLQSTFLEMFGNPVTNPQGWTVKTLGEFAEIGTGSTPSRKNPDNFNGDIPWVKSTEVAWERIDTTSETVSELGRKSARLKLYPRGSVVVALYGQGKTRGKCGILGVDATINQACCALTTRSNVSNIFLYSFLKQSYAQLRSESRGGNQENLNLSIVKSFAIPVPPSDLQNRFATIVQSVEQQKSRLRAHLDELDTLFASLQARAFAGEL